MDVTLGSLERLTWMPDRDSEENGLRTAGQYYYDVYFTGGYASNIELEDPTFTNPIPLAYGGTGSALVDPAADRLMFWDESANAVDWLIAGSGLVITDRTINVAGVGLGDVTGPVGATANGVAVYNGTTGTVIKSTTVTIDGSNNLTANNISGTTSGTNTGDQTITLTGDVTGSGIGSFAATIANNAVSNAKFRQSVALSVVGVAGNATANVADIVAAVDGEVLRRSGTTVGFGTVATAGITDDAVTLAKLENGTQGDILYYGASGAPTRLGAGTSGQYLKTQGAGANPLWADVTVTGKKILGRTRAVSTSQSNNGASFIPADNTIPQNGEGFQVLTVTHNRQSATSQLLVRWRAHASNNSLSGPLCSALFQDATAGALAVGVESTNNTYIIQLEGDYELVSGSTGNTTFNIRIGGASGTTYFNQPSGGALYGGVVTSFIEVIEIEA